MNGGPCTREKIQIVLILNEPKEEDDSVVYIGRTEPTPTKPTNVDYEVLDALPIMDPALEYLDPNPDIYRLFVKFSADYFWNGLQSVEVMWSKRMTMCAGLCKYYPRIGRCTISLSEPLLQFRPRSDLVNTLLHEMIHAYLFVTCQNTDHSGHGPKFVSHMQRINMATRSNITILHNFIDEVQFHKKHWWRCDGPCKNRKPYYGYCKRSMNRAPGPNDIWWSAHQRSCGGKFIKIKEPEKPMKETKISGQKNIQTFFK